MSQTRVSVAIPAYNEELQIEQTIRDLQSQDYQGEVEIIVVDNASTDRTAEVAQKAGATVVTEPRKGTRFAYDKGIRSASGELVLVTNADTRLPQNWISKIVAAYADPQVVGVGTRVRFFNVSPWINFCLDLINYRLNPKQAMWGTSLSCRKWVFDKVGGFDHGVNVNEDAIFSLLIEKFGKVKVLDDVFVEMDGRRFNKGLLNSIREWFKGYGLNSLYIQLSYLVTGEIRTLRTNFADYRSENFGKGETEQIAVIIPVGNNQKQIARILTCLQEQDFNYSFQIYALDNFCIDQSLNIARLFPNVHIMKFPGAYTLGEKLTLLLQSIQAPVTAFTGPEVEVAPDWLNQIYTYFDRHPATNSVLSGPVINVNMNVIGKVAQQPLASLANKPELRNCAMRTSLAIELIRGKAPEDHLVDQISARKPEIEFLPQLKSYIDGPDSVESIRSTFRKLTRFRAEEEK
ncbi:MAG: glycosyltransferase [Candidatus Doudnabacteria bacterium]|nr:glycosyltransferase [Candidatus Doudnabacteria bacterium]